jgi:hypothetical protein
MVQQQMMIKNDVEIDCYKITESIEVYKCVGVCAGGFDDK